MENRGAFLLAREMLRRNWSQSDVTLETSRLGLGVHQTRVSSYLLLRHTPRLQAALVLERATDGAVYPQAWTEELKGGERVKWTKLREQLVARKTLRMTAKERAAA